MWQRYTIAVRQLQLAAPLPFDDAKVTIEPTVIPWDPAGINSKKEQSLTLVKLLEVHQKSGGFLVIGDSGSGKSTCLDLLKSLYIDKGGVVLVAQKYGDYVAGRLKDQLKALVERLGMGRLSDGWLNDLCASFADKPVMLVIDGLTDYATSKELLRDVEQLLSTHSNIFLAASGRANAHIRSNSIFSTYKVNQLSLHQQFDLVQKTLPAVKVEFNEIHRMNENTKELTCNPLLLKLVVITWGKGGRSRSATTLRDIYTDYMRRLLERSLDRDLVDYCFIALPLVANDLLKNSQTLFEKQDISRRLKDVGASQALTQSWFNPVPSPTLIVRSLEDSGVIIEMPGRRFKFFHDSILDYLGALSLQYLPSLPQYPKPLWDDISRYLAKQDLSPEFEIFLATTSIVSLYNVRLLSSRIYSSDDLRHATKMVQSSIGERRREIGIVGYFSDSESVFAAIKGHNPQIVPKDDILNLISDEEVMVGGCYVNEPLSALRVCYYFCREEIVRSIINVTQPQDLHLPYLPSSRAQARLLVIEYATNLLRVLNLALCSLDSHLSEVLRNIISWTGFQAQISLAQSDNRYPLTYAFSAADDGQVVVELQEVRRVSVTAGFRSLSSVENFTRECPELRVRKAILDALGTILREDL